MSARKRLKYHQQKSKFVMDELKQWLESQFDQNLTEPNSTLGKAINYMRNHWDKLTLFLSVAKAPLDNNIAEWALKQVIVKRLMKLISTLA